MKNILTILSFFVLFSYEKESEQSDFINNTKKKYNRLSSAWNSVKRTAKEMWKAVKTVVSADTRRVAIGAMVDLAGGTICVASAFTKLFVKSVRKCIYVKF